MTHNCVSFQVVKFILKHGVFIVYENQHAHSGLADETSHMQTFENERGKLTNHFGISKTK